LCVGLFLTRRYLSAFFPCKQLNPGGITPPLQ
jgi:hypothetical protein